MQNPGKISEFLQGFNGNVPIDKHIHIEMHICELNIMKLVCMEVPTLFKLPPLLRCIQSNTYLKAKFKRKNQ